MATKTTKAIKMKFSCSDGSSLILSFINAAENISLETLKKNFLPVAKPVLGVVSLDEAYYLTTNKEDLDD